MRMGLFLCCILFVVGGLVGWVRYETADIVWTTPIAEGLSPDKAWKATVDETVVEGFMATGIAAAVHLVSMEKPNEIVDVLGVDTGGHHEERPRISWISPNVLQVTVDNLSYVTVDRRSYGNIRIDLRFDPDDPAARAAWLRKQDQPIPRSSER
jgi:hypothetical protein